MHLNFNRAQFFKNRVANGFLIAHAKSDHVTFHRQLHRGIQTAMLIRRRGILVITAGMGLVVAAAPATWVAGQPLAVVVADDMKKPRAGHV